MASLKKELEAVALRLGSRGSVPGTQQIELQSGTGVNLVYVAPSDGYLTVHGKVSGNAGSYISARSHGTLGYGTLFNSESKSEFMATIFISTAISVLIMATGDAQLTSVYFTPTLGSTS